MAINRSQIISSKVAIGILLILLVFFANLKYQQWKNQQVIEQQKQDLQEQANQWQQKNDELTQSLQYLNSSSYREQVARQQLNLKINGENVYSFTTAAAQATTTALASPAPSLSNPRKWWNYFFQNN